MNELSEDLIQAWENKQGPIILTTVSNDKIPNAIYATCISLYDSQTILVADNYMDKTKQNLLNSSYGSILFITKDNQAFQIKGSLEYHQQGDLFEDMKKWNPKKHPGHAVVALKIDQVYSGAKKIL